MSPRDFALLLLVCFVWALNTILGRIAVAEWGVPPLFFAGLRFALVALAVSPWLFPMPKPRGRLIAVALLMGAGTFGLVSVGLRTASPSAAAVVIQLGIPITALFSIVLLGERIRWLRGVGIVLALVGTLAVMWDPHGVSLSGGLLFVAASAASGSLAAVMMKQFKGVRPLQFQAWIGFTSAILLSAFSAALEVQQWPLALQAGWAFIGATVFAALVVSVLGHTLYYGLIQRYDANVVAPLTLLSPLMTIALGVALTGDTFDMRMACGSFVALVGVLVIVLGRQAAGPADRPAAEVPVLAEASRKEGGHARLAS